MDYPSYYKQIYVLFEIVKNLNARETVFAFEKENSEKRSFIRGIKAFTIDFFNRNADAQDFFNRKCKIYHSLAILKPFPTHSFEYWKRKDGYKDLRDYFISDYMDGFTFAIDLDGSKEKLITKKSQVYKDAVTLKGIFDSFGLPYSLKFSGNKGFHFSIEDHYFDYLFVDYELPNSKEMAKVQFFEDLIYNLKMIENIQTLDDSIYDERRIFKAPYSLDTIMIDGERKDTVVLPLSDEQFEDFDIKDYILENVISNVRIMKRGLLTRKGTDDGMKKFVKEYGDAN